MMVKNINTSALLFCFFLLCGSGVIAVYAAAGSGGDVATQKECGEQFQKLTTCLEYAQGKTATPSPQCCGSVKDIKEKDPKCLCYIIQQAHSGSSDMLKSLGVQEAKLLHLPSACQLQNASITYCPKLLGISPSSPDAAIFSSNASTTAAPATPTGKSASVNADKSDGTKLAPTAAIAFAFALAMFFYAVPAGAASMFYKRG